jgi:predicted nuclease of predicted toxin-antitoxin system
LGKKRVALALRGARVEVHVHDDHFAPDARDVDWLAEVGAKGWVVLTKDRGIRWRSLERTAAMTAGVALFTLTSGNLNGAEMAEIFVKALPAMCRFLAKHSPPFIASVTRRGRVRTLFEGRS